MRWESGYVSRMKARSARATFPSAGSSELLPPFVLLTIVVHAMFPVSLSLPARLLRLLSGGAEDWGRGGDPLPEDGDELEDNEAAGEVEKDAPKHGVGETLQPPPLPNP